MNKTSIWYNQEWPDYYCSKCGVLHQFYVDGRCSDCRKSDRDNMEEILIKTRKKAVKLNRKKNKRKNFRPATGSRKGLIRLG